MLIASLILPGPAHAESHDAEVDPFRLTDISGSISVRYLLDDRDRDHQDSSGSFETQEHVEADLYLLTRSYIYHPEFVDMKIGGGPLLVLQDFDSTPGSNSTSEALFNFLADLNFLSEKAYPVRTYYQLSHPSVATSLSGSFLVERNEYGLTAQLRAPVSPIQFTLDAFHIDTLGSGFGATLDEDIDELSLTAFKSYRAADRISLAYRWNQSNSLSGSPGLAIQESRITTRSVDVDARNLFGMDSRLELVQQVNLVDQDTKLDTLSTLQDRRYFGNLNWAHTRNTRTYYQYRYQQTERPAQTDASHRAALAGITSELGQHLILTGEVTVENDRDIAFDRQLAGARANVNYSRPIPFGSIHLGAGLGVRRTDQVSDDDEAQVFDEPAVLNGTDPAILRNDFINTDTVIVRNESKTQVFVDGLDYRLLVVGRSTSIQRLIGGNIADGQTVLLEYSYLTGGTAEFDTLSQDYSIDLHFLDHFSVYARLSGRHNSLISGVPVIPLNSIQSLQLGGRVDYPLGNRWTIGGEYLHTDHNEEISSFIRNSYDVYAEVLLPLTTSLRLMFHQERVDNEGSIEDVDLVQYRASLRSRPFRGIVVSWNSDYLEDVGGSLFRERISHRLSVGWVYRQMRIVLRGERFSETLGATVRDDIRITAQIQRAF